MAKIATKYYQVNPWKVIEKGFDRKRAQVSESIFSLANEYMGIRGFFDETYSGNKLIGTYFNGIYEVPFEKPKGGYKGISHDIHYMVNSVNFFKTIIKINNIEVDLAKCDFKDFYRELNMKTGELIRSYIYVQGDVEVVISFSRILDMVNYPNAYQKIEICSKTKDVKVEVLSLLDYSIVHWGQFQYWNVKTLNKVDRGYQVISETKQTEQKILTDVEFVCDLAGQDYIDKYIGKVYDFILKKDQTFNLEKRLTHIAAKLKEETTENMFGQLAHWLKKRSSFTEVLKTNSDYYEKMWSECDIKIDGDDENQQGIRYCIFQLMQTYQGVSPTNNIGAKGLTGEAYSGHAFWDTETYCLPFYLFHNPLAAKNLLMFRYNTLKAAKARAKDLDCDGACYPIATLNGTEGCNLWQHASLQFQPTTAVAYGIWHYVKTTLDYEFLYNYGLEMLVETSRFLASRGDWNHNRTHFGFYGVMGPDEFQMMVNHNTYTNYMAKRTFEYLIESLNDFKKDDFSSYQKFVNKMNLTDIEIASIIEKAEKMYLIYDEKTKLFEQHAGYYDLPHVDINKIPVEEFPLYAHWSYDRIYRNDMIKQPDVLMMMLLHNQSFTFEQKRSNYEFYEPRTIHESSLSPSVHSILAAELGKDEEALKFFGFATRMDLDDYNRNANEGLHMTSIAAAWMNIVYGFGGLRSDSDILTLNPTLPKNWKSFSFSFYYRNRRVDITVSHQEMTVIVTGDELNLKVWGKLLNLKGTKTIGK